jgi:hypothetical protein
MVFCSFMPTLTVMNANLFAIDSGRGNFRKHWRCAESPRRPS